MATRTKKQTPAEKIIADCRANRDENGTATIRAKEVAVLVRAALKREFPRCKFSVRSDYNSVDVHWTDGPCEYLVDRVINWFSFGGFDGMIDMAYDSTNWLLPDGTMVPAHSTGTQGSMGTVEGFDTDCPMPGAILVKYGPRYVNGQRSVSDEHYAVLARIVEAEYGWTIDADKPLWSQYYPNGEMAAGWMRHIETRAAKEAVESQDK